MKESPLTRFAATCKSLVKVALLSRPVNLRPQHSGKELVVLGNGPSLRQTIDSHPSFLAERDLMAVNFAANTPDFTALRPSYYVLVDPHFFSAGASDPNVERLWHRINNEVDWPMTLMVPRVQVRKLASGLTNAKLKVEGLNLVGFEGFKPMEHAAFDARLAMPRPRNVLIPALMAGIWLGYKTIYVAGADHSWTKTLDVDDQNRVVTIQPHFYNDNESEHRRVSSVYKDIRLHQILHSFAVAFKAYHIINRYAKHKGTDIINITPGSFIDAFHRMKLPSE